MQWSVHSWSDLAVDQPMPLIDRQRIIGDRLMISRVVLHEGFEIASHSHENEQMVVMLEGKARFIVGTEQQELVLEAGQVLELRANVPHSCFAIERCVILDIFSPVSEGTGVDKSGEGAISA